MALHRRQLLEQSRHRCGLVVVSVVTNYRVFLQTLPVCFEIGFLISIFPLKIFNKSSLRSAHRLLSFRKEIYNNVIPVFGGLCVIGLLPFGVY